MASVGLYLRYLPAEIWQEFVAWIFKKYPNVNMIYIHHTTTPQTFPSTLHCHINLPQTIEEFNAQLSSRVRYNTKWYPKKIREAFGDYEIKCWQRNEMPQQAYDLFKKWKKEALDYTVPDNFMDEHVITHVYAVIIKEEIVRLVLFHVLMIVKMFFMPVQPIMQIMQNGQSGVFYIITLFVNLFTKRRNVFCYMGVKVIPISTCLMGLIPKLGMDTYFDPKFKRWVKKILSWHVRPLFLQKIVLIFCYKWRLNTQQYKTLKKFLKYNKNS